jgi:hypothetical protein
MGAGASTVTEDDFAKYSAEDVGAKVASLGESYAEYKQVFVDKSYDGSKLSALQPGDDVLKVLKDIGVKDVDQQLLLNEFEKIKVHSPRVSPRPTEAGVSTSGGSSKGSIRAVVENAPVSGSTKESSRVASEGSSRIVTAAPESGVTSGSVKGTPRVASDSAAVSGSSKGSIRFDSASAPAVSDSTNVTARGSPRPEGTPAPIAEDPVSTALHAVPSEPLIESPALETVETPAVVA